MKKQFIIIFLIYPSVSFFIPNPKLPKTPTVSMSLSNKFLVNTIPGIEVSIPVLIYENIFTTLHYGYEIFDIKTFILVITCTYITYGFDRFFDSQEYFKSVKHPQENKHKLSYKISNNKLKLYNYLNENKQQYNTILGISYLYNCIIFYDNIFTQPFILLLTASIFYKYYKNKLGPFKSLYIGFMWSGITYFLPCILHDNNLNSLLYPLDYLPLILSLTSASNLADSKDIEEDRINNITTLPVLYGNKISNSLSSTTLLIASILIFINPNYQNNLLFNNIFLLQNLVTSCIPILMNQTIINL